MVVCTYIRSTNASTYVSVSYFETNNESVNRGIRGLDVDQPGGWFVSRNKQRIRDCWTCS